MKLLRVGVVALFVATGIVLGAPSNAFAQG